MRKAKQKFHTVTMNGRRPHTERRATLFETKHFAVGEAGWGGFKVTHKRTGTGIPGLTHNRKTAERVAMAFEQRPEFARRSRRIRTFTDLAKQGVAILRRYKNWPVRMNQPDLLEGIPQRFRNTDPDTSVEAAASVSTAIRAAQQRVLDWLRTQKQGATDEELLAAMESRSSHFRTRRSELVDRGLVKDSGQRRKLMSGRMGIVWVAV